jgi:hypothetical protein
MVCYSFTDTDYPLLIEWSVPPLRLLITPLVIEWSFRKGGTDHSMSKGVLSSRKGVTDHSISKGVLGSRKGGTDHSMSKGVLSSFTATDYPFGH